MKAPALADQPAALEPHSNAHPEGRRSLDDLSTDLREQTWRSTLLGQADPAFTLLAEGDDATTTGFCCIAVPSRDGDAGQRTAEIAAAYVDPASWGIGIGRALIEHGLARLSPGGWEQ